MIQFERIKMSITKYPYLCMMYTCQFVTLKSTFTEVHSTTTETGEDPRQPRPYLRCRSVDDFVPYLSRHLIGRDTRHASLGQSKNEEFKRYTIENAGSRTASNLYVHTYLRLAYVTCVIPFANKNRFRDHCRNRLAFVYPQPPVSRRLSRKKEREQFLCG